MEANLTQKQKSYQIFEKKSRCSQFLRKGKKNHAAHSFSARIQKGFEARQYDYCYGCTQPLSTSNPNDCLYTLEVFGGFVFVLRSILRAWL